MTRGLSSDVRYAVRVLARSPGFTAVAVLSLAIGVGANTAMLGVIETVLRTPLAVDRPEDLALVGWSRDGDFSISQTGSGVYRDPETGAGLRTNFSYPIYEALRATTPPDAGLFAFAFLRAVSVAVGDQPALLAGGALADGRYFSELRVDMELGRPLTEADDTPDALPVAVLGHAFWMRAFGGDPAVVGRTVRVNGVPVEVVGVTGEGFHGLSMGGFFPRTEITVPLSAHPLVATQLSEDASLFTSDDVFWLRLMARAPRGAERARLEDRLEGAMRSTPSPLVADDGFLPDVRLVPGEQGAQPVRPETARLLYLLLAVVGVVLLIACVNLGSLMLARGSSRRREIAVRRSLGASRARILRQVVVEGSLLAAAGTAGAIVMTLSTRGALGELLTHSLAAGAFGNVDMQPSLDLGVLLLGATAGAVATLLFTVLPALRLTDTDPGDWLKHRGTGGAASRLTAGRVLIALQVAVTLPLVVGAGLFVRTIGNLGAVELGFDPTGVVMFQVDPAFTSRAEDEHPRLYREILAELAQVPGVRSVTLMENALLSGISSNSSVELDGERHMMYRNAVGPGFLETLGMRLDAGRVPGVQDDEGSGPVGAVNQRAVQVLFGGASPLGRTIRFGGSEVLVVGVVNDVPYRNRREPVPPTLYPSALQVAGYGGHNVVMRTDVPATRLEPVVREVVSRIDADLPVPELRTQTDLLAGSQARERVFTQLLTIFGGFALLLASIGLNGVTSYAVTRRTGEIGVRMAVGARPGQVLWMILRQVVLLAGVGIAIGLPLALAVAPTVGSLLFGVAPSDPVTLLGSGAVLLVVAVVAGLLPAVRAAGTEATVALGTE